MGSKILEFIRNNPDNWEQNLNDRGIHTNHREDRVCFKYGYTVDYSDPLVCEARGIVIDISEMQVVCWPFDKFFNIQEQYASEIDWDTARVLEKVDGSLIKLYWYKNEWVFATSSTCDASDAAIQGSKKTTYRDIIARADNYGKIPFNELDRDYTYMFELVSPETQVVIKYDITTLYYLAARNNLTGEEKDTGFEDFKKPARYLLKTLDDCMKAVMELNKDPEADLQDEGFVVVDALHRRIKIKSPAYIALHRAAGNKVFTLKRIVELFIQNTDFAKLANDFPKEARIIKYYEWQFEEVRHDIDEMIKYARALYEEYDHDRRALASAIKDSKFSWAGFAAIGNEKNVDDLMKMITPTKLESAVADYDEYAKIRKNLFGKEDGTK